MLAWEITFEETCAWEPALLGRRKLTDFAQCETRWGCKGIEGMVGCNEFITMWSRIWSTGFSEGLATHFSLSGCSQACLYGVRTFECPWFYIHSIDVGCFWGEVPLWEVTGIPWRYARLSGGMQFGQFGQLNLESMRSTGVEKYSGGRRGLSVHSVSGIWKQCPLMESFYPLELRLPITRPIKVLMWDL